MQITKEDAKMISDVLNKGMPDEQKKRDALASLDYELRQYINS